MDLKNIIESYEQTLNDIYHKTTSPQLFNKNIIAIERELIDYLKLDPKEYYRHTINALINKIAPTSSMNTKEAPAPILNLLKSNDNMLELAKATPSVENLTNLLESLTKTRMTYRFYHETIFNDINYFTIIKKRNRVKVNHELHGVISSVKDLLEYISPYNTGRLDMNYLNDCIYDQLISPKIKKDNFEYQILKQNAYRDCLIQSNKNEEAYRNQLRFAIVASLMSPYLHTFSNIQLIINNLYSLNRFYELNELSISEKKNPPIKPLNDLTKIVQEGSENWNKLIKQFELKPLQLPTTNHLDEYNSILLASSTMHNEYPENKWLEKSYILQNKLEIKKSEQNNSTPIYYTIPVCSLQSIDNKYRFSYNITNEGMFYNKILDELSLTDSLKYYDPISKFNPTDMNNLIDVLNKKYNTEFSFFYKQSPVTVEMYNLSQIIPASINNDIPFKSIFIDNSKLELTYNHLSKTKKEGGDLIVDLFPHLKPKIKNSEDYIPIEPAPPVPKDYKETSKQIEENRIRNNLATTLMNIYDNNSRAKR